MTSRFADRYAREFLAGWGAMDFNGHMANWAYLNLAADVRMAFFAEHGFPPREFRRLALGPVMRKDELEYFREVGLHETVTVTYAALAMSPDGARSWLRTRFGRPLVSARPRSGRPGAGSICASASSLHRQPPCSRCFNRSPARRALSNCLPAAVRSNRRMTLKRRADSFLPTAPGPSPGAGGQSRCAGSGSGP